MNKYYKPPRFSPYNPFFRQKLLTSSNNKLISDILIELRKETIEEAIKAHSIEDISNTLWKIILLFSDGSGLSISSILPTTFELKSFTLTRAFLFPGGILFPHDNSKRYLSIKDLMYKERAFFDLYNFQISQAYLLKETHLFVKSCSIPNLMNDIGIRGIGFKSAQNKHLNIYLGNEKTKRNLHLDFNQNVIQSGLLEKSLSFNSLGVPFKGRVSRRSFLLPRIKVNAKYTSDLQNEDIKRIVISHNDLNHDFSDKEKKTFC